LHIKYIINIINIKYYNIVYISHINFYFNF